jgi:hypothetical protein
MTIGEERVRVDFNTDNLSDVNDYKAGVAVIIDELQPLVDIGGDAGRCAKIAQLKFEEAAMWAVKAVTEK